MISRYHLRLAALTLTLALSGCVFGFDTDYPVPDSEEPDAIDAGGDAVDAGDADDGGEAGDASDAPDSADTPVDADLDLDAQDAEVGDVDDVDDGSRPDTDTDTGTDTDADADTSADTETDVVAVPDAGGGRNACGGTGPLLWDGAAALPGDACGTFREGALACAGLDVLRCVGEAERNACGTVGALPHGPGEACGCGGVWACREGGGLTCTGGVVRNECGGCFALDGRPGVPCSLGTDVGLYACDGADSIECVPDRNACGGPDPLRDPDDVVSEALPGDVCSAACGPGTWVCDGPDALRCVSDVAGNLCGGCASLAGNPGDVCGVFADGVWQCDGADRVACDGASDPNACGGSEALAGQPGEPCGVAGTWICAGGDVVCLELAGSEPNACGGTSTLTGAPGDPCGACGLGALQCTGTDALVCSLSDAEQRNVCGACGPLLGAEGDACGVCADGSLACAESGTELVCEAAVEAPNECGSCGDLGASSASACGECGTFTCAGGRLRCELPPGGCPRPDTCADLRCDRSGRACSEAVGSTDASCGACLEGYTEREGACVSDTAVVMDVVASDFSSPDYVEVSWTAYTGAVGYHVYRDGERITVAPVTGTVYRDSSASPAPPPRAPDVAATTDGDEVIVTWTSASSPHGPVHEYAVTAIVGTSETARSAVDQGRRQGWGTDWYELSIDGGPFVLVPDTREYVDTGAPSPFVAAGEVTASDATSLDAVDVTVAGQGVRPGPDRLYVMRGVSSRVGPGTESEAAVGRRAWLGPAETLQWQRSAGSDPADFADLPGQTSPTWRDLDAPAGGQARWYRVVVSAEGLPDAVSEPDDGRRLSGGALAAPTGLTATFDGSVDHVDLAWDTRDGAATYRIYRDGERIAEVPATETSYRDAAAAAPGPCGAPVDVVATTARSTDVTVSWTAPPCAPQSHEYTVSATDAGGIESALSLPATGRRSGYPVTGYEVSIDGGSWVPTGTGTGWSDATAPEASYFPDTASASDGEFASYVDLSLPSDYSVPGASRSYRVRALNGLGASPAAPDAIGRRAFTGISGYQWQRSAGEADTDYADLPGATLELGRDFGAPPDGSPRWYRVEVTLRDGSRVFSDPDQGSRRTE